jgi:hypothetical protein
MTRQDVIFNWLMNLFPDKTKNWYLINSFNVICDIERLKIEVNK